jgi:hypothetical protein
VGRKGNVLFYRISITMGGAAVLDNASMVHGLMSNIACLSVAVGSVCLLGAREGGGGHTHEFDYRPGCLVNSRQVCMLPTTLCSRFNNQHQTPRLSLTLPACWGVFRAHA